MSTEQLYEQLLKDYAHLQSRLEEAEETLNAIRSSEVDALVITTTAGNQIFTLQSADHPYRLLVEQMKEGAVTLTPDGVILYCNSYFAGILGHSQQALLAQPIHQFFAPDQRALFDEFVHKIILNRGIYGEFNLQNSRGESVPVYIAANLLMVDQTQLMCLVFNDLTARKKIENDMLESENRFRSVFVNSMDAILLVTTDGDILSANASAARMFGYEDEGLIGRGLSEFIEADYDKLIRVSPQPDMQNDEFLMELTLVRRDGTRFPGEISSSSFEDAQGHELTTLIIRDITERRRTAEALALSEARYRSVVTATSDGIILEARGGVLQSHNKAAEHILGLSHDQMLGLEPVDPNWLPVHEDGSPFLPEDFPSAKALSTGQEVLNVVMGVNKPGPETLWILVNSQPIFENDDPLPAAVVTSFTDITELKRVETLLKKSEERFRAISQIITNYAYGFAVGEGNTLYHDWTVGAFAEITGYTPEQLAERGGWSTIFHPDDMPIALERAKQLFAGQDVVHEFRIITASQEVRWLRDYGLSVWDDQAGRVTYIFGAAQDITEHKLLEQQALDLAAEKQRVRLLADFMRDTSHDLRTPITSISTGLYLIRHITDDARRAEKITQVEKHVSYLTNVLEKLQQMAVLDSMTELPLKSGKIARLLGDIVPLAQDRAGSKHISVVADLESDPVMISFDAASLYRALIELVDNAIRYTPEGGQIMISSRRAGNKHFELEVSDSGSGIDPQSLQHIFDRFYKADASRGSSGAAGLGLPMVKRIVELHFGQIRVESIPDLRTSFTINLPVLDEKQIKA